MEGREVSNTNKVEILEILELAKDENGSVPMSLVRQGFEKLAFVDVPDTNVGNMIPRKAVEYICRKETVSTNPEDFPLNENFI